MNTKITGIAICMFVLIRVAYAIAGTPDGTQRRRGPMGPPPEAYEACKGKNEGDSVELTTPWGETIKTTCKQIDGKLAAMPEGGGRDPRKPHSNSTMSREQRGTDTTTDGGKTE